MPTARHEGAVVVARADLESALNAPRENFWQPFEDRADGDLVNNDFVDFADYAQWKQAAKDPDPLAASQAIPEPSTLMLLAGALLLGVWRRA